MVPDRYSIIRKLAQGGMAEVFLAEDQGLSGGHRLVVIKRIHPKISADEHMAGMFRHEARIAMQLAHPNIAHVYEAGLASDRYFLVMEFIHGADLQQILRRHEERMSPPLAAFIAAHVAAALNHAHGLSDLEGKPLGVVHRDISPPNIRVSHEGAVKVIDFGVAKATAGSYISQDGVTKGKFAYMAPEQISGSHVDHRTDVFALGIVLHEMLTYRSLFAREDINETLQAIMNGDVPPPSEHAGDLPEGLDAIALRALATEPALRYQSAKEMQRDLEQVLRRAPATATDLEALMTRLYGDGRSRLATILARGDAASDGDDDAPATAPAIPSRTPVPKEHELEEFDDDASTQAGYQRLSDDDG